MTKAKTKTKTTITAAMAMAIAMWAVGACGGQSGDPMGDDLNPGATTPAQGAGGAQGSDSQEAAQPRLPKEPTTEAAPTGTLDPQLVGVWPVTGVQVYWAGSGVPDWTVSEPLKGELASAPLLLVADGTFSFGPVVGTWTVIPFPAADTAVWGTGGRGPEGFLRELVLVVNGRVYTRGPIDDPFPPATAPWGLRVAFQVASPKAGTIEVMYQRPTGNTGTGAKK